MPTKIRDKAAEAHRATVQSEISDLTGFLIEVLGTKLTAYMAGVSDARTATRWASGERSPRPETESRLREIFYIFRLIQTSEDVNTVRAWFVGLNPQLDDRSPASVLHDGEVRDVVVAAKSFIAGG